MIAAREDEVSYETFVAIYDEVTTKLFRLLMVADELGGRQAAQVASYRL